MSDKKRFVDIDNKTRNYINKRDVRCIICKSNYNLQIAHVFINRSHGGKGCKENLVLLCSRCHQIMDNPLGKKQNELSKEYLSYCKNYLVKKEKIENIAELVKKIKYKRFLD